MSYAVDTIELNGFTATIKYDESPANPRTEWDNVGTMICFHNRYNLGDKDHGFDHRDYDGWKDMSKAILKEYGEDAIILPVYMYGHSGVALSTGSFTCKWDSGQIGFIVVSRAKVREEWKVKRINKELLSKIQLILEGEVETYSAYLNGEVYGYEIEDEDGEQLDSCWGFYDLDHIKEEVNLLLEHYNSKKQKEEGEQQELFVA